MSGALVAALIASCIVICAPALAASTRADYIAQADPICSQAYADAQPLWAQSVVDEVKGRYKKAARELLASTTVLEGMVVNLEALQPPAADAMLVDSWLNAERDINSLSRQQVKALKHRKPKRAKKLGSRVISGAEAARAIVVDYGFSACNRV